MAVSSAPSAPGSLRTIIPIVVALLAQQGISSLPGVDSTTFSIVVAAVVTYLYYFAVRVLERVSSTKWGWLIGYPAAPTYTGQHAA